jgi:hypothetical protein
MDIKNIDSQAAQTQQSALEMNSLSQVSKINKDAKDIKKIAGTQQPGFEDSANISDLAKRLAERDIEAKEFTKLALGEPEQSSKSEFTSHLKNLLDSGRISEYLRTVNTDSIVNSLLKSGAGKFVVEGY